jgi:uncharacterized membrane protein YfcA
VILVLVDEDLPRANALKNVLLLLSDLLPALLFAVNGRVVWTAVLALTAGTLVGGRIGPSVARRMPQHILRVAISLCGFVLAGWLLYRAI